jgi:hypothetical protein
MGELRPWLRRDERRSHNSPLFGLVLAAVIARPKFFRQILAADKK